MDRAYVSAEGTSRAAGRPFFDRYLVANLSLWSVTYFLITLRSLGMGTPLPKLLNMGLRRAVLCASAVLVCILIKNWLLATRAWPRGSRILLAGGLSVAGGVFYAGFNYVMFYVVAPREKMDWSQGELIMGLVATWSILLWSFITWSAIVFALSSDEEAREQNLRLAQAQALAAESQNQMLRYQINPHFLFNTLNALSSLILQKDFVRAERMVLSLSNFLRASLEKAPSDKITLAEELEAQRQYLAIEQERFGDRLTLIEAAPAGLRDALVPGLILQPLIENAVKYGVARTRRPVAVEIAAEILEGRLRVTVRDDATPDLAEPPHEPPPQTLGVGLANVRRRLHVLYGEAGVLTAGPRADGGFAATIELPLERR